MRTRQVLQVVGYAAIAVLVWLVISTLWMWRNQERVVFQPPEGIAIDSDAARRVDFKASDGKPTYAFVVEPASGAGGTVVLAFHGNADLAVWLIPWARELARRSGATVVVPEYRGYGGVAGRPTYDGVAADARGAMDYVRSLKPKRVVLFGHSLGTAIAVELASTAAPRPDALALQSPFTSARDMAARMLVPAVRIVWTSISRVHYDTRERVAQLDVPVAVAHGRIDITIPARMGREVHEAARNRGELLLVSGAGHNDVPEVGGEDYWRWLASAVAGASAPVRKLEQQRGGRLP